MLRTQTIVLSPCCTDMDMDMPTLAEHDMTTNNKF